MVISCWVSAYRYIVNKHSLGHTEALKGSRIRHDARDYIEHLALVYGQDRSKEVMKPEMKPLEWFGGLTITNCALVCIHIIVVLYPHWDHVQTNYHHCKNTFTASVNHASKLLTILPSLFFVVYRSIHLRDGLYKRVQRRLKKSVKSGCKQNAYLKAHAPLLVIDGR